jgi:hypothetical protein
MKFSDIFAIGLTYLTTCDKILLDMIFGFKKQKKASDKTISDYKTEALVKFGRDQIMKLKNKGLNISVALL